MKKQVSFAIILYALVSCGGRETTPSSFTKAELDSINLLRCDSLVFNEFDSITDVDFLPIPKNIEECFTRLNSIASERRKAWIKCLTEEQFGSKMHFGLGMTLRNKWGLWANSELARYFYNLGVFHPDDMSGMILNSYHRRLSNQPIKLEEQVEYYQNYWTDLGENVDSILDLVKNEENGEKKSH